MKNQDNLKEEYRLKTFYTLRNHFGANALKNGPGRFLNHNLYWDLTKRRRDIWKGANR